MYAQLSLFNWYEGIAPYYVDEVTDRLFRELRVTVALDERDRIQREIGNRLYDQYGYILFHYLFIEFVANPNIIDQWPFPGSDGSNHGHWDMITACTTPQPCLD